MTNSSINKAFLLREFQLFSFFECWKKQKEDKGSATLFVANQEKFEIHRENFVPVDDISKLIDEALKCSKRRTCVELSLKYDCKNETFQPLLNFIFDKTFVRKLNQGLPSVPTVDIDGEAEFCKNGMTLSSANTTVTFSISDVALEDQTILDFKGSSEFSHYFNTLNTTQSSILVRLKYSIIFSWKKVPGGDYRLQREKLNMLETLWKDKLLSDCVIVASNEAEIKCHRSILAAQSSVFRAMFLSELQESQENKIEMKDMTEKGVEALLTYLYKWDIKSEELPEEICLELLYAAHKYDISTLENLIVDTLLDKPDEWFSINVVLELYFFTVNVGSCNLDLLTEKLVDILKRNQRELGNSVFYQELKANNSTQLVDLEVKLLELHKL